MARLDDEVHFAWTTKFGRPSQVRMQPRYLDLLVNVLLPDLEVYAHGKLKCAWPAGAKHTSCCLDSRSEP